MTRNRFRLLLVKQALLQKKPKAFLIILAAAMGASVVTALLNVEVDLRFRMNRELREFGPNVVLMHRNQNSDAHLDSSVLTRLKSMPDILAFTPQLYVPATAGTEQTFVVGCELKAMKTLYPNWQWDSSSTGEAMVGKRLAGKLGLNRGESVDVVINGKSRSLKVSGFLEGGEAEDDQLFVPLSLAQQMAELPDQFHIVSVSVLGDLKTVESLFSQVFKNDPQVEVQVIRKIAAAETSLLDKISKLVVLVISIIFIILFFCINTTVSAILLSRQAEIALFRVLGARRNQIMAGLTFELLILALFGAVFGFFIGIMMAQIIGKLLFNTLIMPRFSIFLITLLSSLFMMIFSSFRPLKRVINRQAALVLKEV